jgi:hypothetical protein
MRRASLLGFIASFCVLVGSAAQVNRPSPATRSDRVGRNPVLHWSWDEANLLENGGFEQGLAGWTLPVGGSGTLQKSTTGGFEGTNYVTVLFGPITREIAVPDSAGPITLSFAANRTSFEGLSTQLRSTDGRLLKVEPFWSDGAPFTDYAFRYVDLTPYAGRTLQMTLNVTSFDNVPQSFDDFRISTAPQDVMFDVYVGGSNAPKWVGRTNRTSWPLKGLGAGSYLYWRVDAIVDGVTNRGPVWQFSTAFGPAATHMELSPMIGAICPAMEVTVMTVARDNQGFRTFVQAPAFFAAAENARPSTLVISEIDTGANDGVELMNVSTNTIQVGGWRLQLYDRSDTLPAANIVLPQGASIAPGGVATYRETETVSAWPNLRLPTALGWGDIVNNPLKAGVILRDAASNIIDCVFIDQTRPDDQTFGQRPLVTMIDWRPPAIVATETNKTYQRRGNSDHNNSDDWILEASSMKTVNPSIQTSFLGGYGKVDVTFQRITNLTTVALGEYTAAASAHFNGSWSNVNFFAANLLSKLWGMSEAFTVVPPGNCLALMAVTNVTEGSGVMAGALRVQLSEPATADVPVHFKVSDPRLMVGDVIIPSGASEVVLDLTIGDDDLLQGTNKVTIVAGAAGYSSSVATLNIADDERATLTLVGPATVTENEGIVYYIESSRAPAVDIPIYVRKEGFGFQDEIVLLNAGKTNAGFYLGYDDAYLQPVSPVHVTASFENWTAATADIGYIDNDPPIIGIQGPLAGLESNAVILRVQLGGAVMADFPITITSSDPESLQVPPSVTVPAFSDSAEFTIGILDNLIPTLNRTVQITLSGPPLIGTNFTFTISDNDPAAFEMQTPPGPWTANQPLPVKIRAVTMEGSVAPMLPLEGGVFTATDVARNVVSPFTQLQGLSPVGDGWLATALSFSEASTKTKVRYEQAGISGSFDIPIWESVPTNLLQVAYSAAQDAYVVRNATAMWTVNALNGAAKFFTPAIESSGPFALSRDGNTVFAIGNSGQKIYRGNLATMQVTSWAFDSSGVYTARSISLLPGVVDGLAIARLNNFAMEIAKYEGGELLASARVPYLDDPLLSATADGSAIFVGGQGLMFAFQSPSRNELAIEDSLSSTFRSGAYPAPSLAFGDNFFAAPSGVIADPIVHGEYSATEIAPDIGDGKATAFDPVTHRFARLTQTSPMDLELQILEPITFRVIGRQPVHYVKSGLWSLAPAGSHGWAAIIGGDFQLIRNPAITLPTETKLGVTAQVVTYPDSPRVMRVAATVTNSGSSPAPDALLTVAASDGAIVLNDPAPRVEANALTHAYAIGDLAPGASRTFTLDITAPFTGTLRAEILVGSRAPEQDYADNRALVSKSISVDDAPAPPRLSITSGEGQNLQFIAYDQPGWGFVLQKAYGLEGPWFDVNTFRATSAATPVGGVSSVEAPALYFRLKRIP